MGLNAGHAIRAKGLKVKRTTPSLVVFEGACGERFYIRAEDWPKLKEMLDSAIAKAVSLPEVPAEVAVNLDALET